MGLFNKIGGFVRGAGQGVGNIFQTWQENRTQRQENRQNANTAAYQAGIDPKESMWKGITNLGDNLMDGIMMSQTGGLSAMNPFASGCGKMNWKPILIIIGVIVFIIWIFKRKK